MLRRGTPNRSDHARPELCLVHTRPWYYSGRWVEMTGAQFDELSDRGKELLVSARI